MWYSQGFTDVYDIESTAVMERYDVQHLKRYICSLKNFKSMVNGFPLAFCIRTHHISFLFYNHTSRPVAPAGKRLLLTPCKLPPHFPGAIPLLLFNKQACIDKKEGEQ